MEKTTIEQLIFTLNQIEVKGADNLNRLLGCIQVLDQARKQEEVKADG